MKLTPVALSKKLEIRPQMIFNWIKQGCPSYKIGGKNYVDDKEVEEWLEQKAETKKERQTEAAQKRSQQDKIGREASEAMGKFRPQRIKHLCGNCEEETEFLCDLIYTGEPGSNYVHAYCSKCKLNNKYSQGEILNEELLDVLLEGKSLFVPCYQDDCPCEKRAVVLPVFTREGYSNPKDIDPYQLSKEDKETVKSDQMLIAAQLQQEDDE